MLAFSFVLLLMLASSRVSTDSQAPRDEHTRYSLLPTEFLSLDNRKHPGLASRVGSPSFHDSSRALTWEVCQKDVDCAPPRICRSISIGGHLKRCSRGGNCVCELTTYDTCLSDADCHDGEGCVLPFADSVGACLSKAVDAGAGIYSQGSATPSASTEVMLSAEATQPYSSPNYIYKPSFGSQGSATADESFSTSSVNGRPRGGSLCVGINALGQFARKNLVFKKDELATVLCDSFESCATWGHIVMINGTVMMMSSYCGHIKCEERLMLVNSPKFRRKLMVVSRTPGLFFTAFSARYGTRFEETLFQVLARLGV